MSEAIHPDILPAHSAERLTFEFVKRPGLLKITVLNFLFGIITLGFYRFWGKTKVRQHIWSSVHINNEPLEYTGTGMELFKGFMVVFCFGLLPIAILIGAISLVQGPESVWISVVQGLVFLVVYVFWGFALYKARKYQLARTNWRGIRGTLVGSAMIYSLTYFGSLLAKSMSMGWATPVMNTVLQEQIISDMRFGDAAFKFRGRAGKLYPTYAACWFLSLLAIAVGIGIGWWIVAKHLTPFFKKLFDQSISHTASEYLNAWLIGGAAAALFVAYMLIIPMLWAIYTAKELRTFADFTRFDGSQFKLHATAGSVIWLTFINVLIIVLTLGIGRPFVQRRLVQFFIDRLELEGAVDVDRIRQSQSPLESRGEGLADAFDVGGL